MRRVKIPSVTISIRVWRETFEPKRTRKPDSLAKPLAEIMRHALGGGACGEPPRLEHQDAARSVRRLRPLFRCQHERHPRRLAGAGWRDQNGRIIGAQCRGEFRQRGVDWQRGRIHVLGFRHSGRGQSPANPESLITSIEIGAQCQFYTGCDYGFRIAVSRLAGMTSYSYITGHHARRTKSAAERGQTD